MVTKFGKLKLFIYGNILFWIVSFVFFLNAFIFIRDWFLWLFLGLGTISLVISVLLSKKRLEYSNILRETNEFTPEFYQKYFDRYGRRLANWIIILFFEIFEFCFSLLNLGFNSKPIELFEKLNANLIIFELVIFFIVKNCILLRWLLSCYEFEKKKALIRMVLNVLIFSSVYWLIASGGFYLFEKIYVINSSPFFTGLYIFIAVLFNLFEINKFAYKRRKHNKLVVAVAVLALIIFGGYRFLSRDIWLTQPYINSVANIYDGNSEITYDDQTGIYTITTDGGDFKILQLTDIHLGGSFLSYDKDMMALQTIYTLLDETRPDFVIVTGDLAFPVAYASFSFNNTATVQQFAAFMRNTGIPWAFTYGNHDTESYAASSKNTLNELYKSLSYKTSKNLLYPYIQPDITGRNNQVIELRNPDGSMNQALYLIDSNAYSSDGGKGYDYIHDDQVDWYASQVIRINEEEGRNVPSLIFIHIPLQEYKTAYELYLEGSKKVTYYFGENNETYIDTICCSDHPSKLFDTAEALGSTTGIFCGHDHYNNMSLEYKGIRLTYGMSIDYLAMSGIARDTEQRGATLITIHEDGTTDIEQVPFGKRKLKIFGELK